MHASRFTVLAAGAAIVLLALAGCAPGDAAAPAPSETAEGSSPDIEVETPTTASYSSAEFDGVPWTSAFESASYFAGGSTLIDPTGNPYFQLALPSASTTDGRQLTISLFNFPGGTGQWQSIAQVLLSSNDAMQGFQTDVPEQNTDFVFEITSWETQADGSVIFSATYGGTLAGLLGSPATVVTNGVITDLDVVVYTEAF